MTDTFLQRNNYYPMLYIAGARISDNRIDGAIINVKHVENDAASMTVTLRPATGSQSLTAYSGKTIWLNIQTSSGIERVFTGVIDRDDYNIETEILTLRCTDDRRNKINQTMTTAVDNIGFFSPDVFGDPKDTAAELDNRLSTIPYALNFDRYGNRQLTAWAPKNTADFTLTDASIFRDDPKVLKTYRGNIINQITIRASYKYPRLHHRERTWSWNSNVSVCNFLLYGYSLASKEMISQAVDSAGWPLKSTISYTSVYPSGSYSCNGVTLGWVGPSQEGQNYNPTTPEGNLQSDQAGNPVIKSASTVTTNASNKFCIGATWIATKRWTQSIEESYSVTVKAPQSISQYGTLETGDNLSLNDEYDASDWEDYNALTDLNSDFNSRKVFLTDQNGDTITDYIIDQDTNRDLFNIAMVTLLNRAKTTILKTHRENKVSFKRSIWPQVDCHHTVEIAATKVTAKGKVYSVEHNINIGTGEATTTVELALYRSTGSQADSSLVAPTPTAYTPRVYKSTISLQSHYGQSPQATWNGHIGNKWNTVNNNSFRTNYQEMFIVDTPPIEPEIRRNKILVNTANYNVSIPNNTLTITFTGTL